MISSVCATSSPRRHWTRSRPCIEKLDVFRLLIKLGVCILRCRCFVFAWDWCLLWHLFLCCSSSLFIVAQLGRSNFLLLFFLTCCLLSLVPSSNMSLQLCYTNKYSTTSLKWALFTLIWSLLEAALRRGLPICLSVFLREKAFA